MTTAATAQPVTYSDTASIFRFSVERYQRMIEIGIIGPDDGFELLEGYILVRIPIDAPHEKTIDLATAALPAPIPSDWLLRIQQTVVFSDSQLEPDFALVRVSAAEYQTRHPGPADVGLVIEVADSSLLRDQRDKTRIYARGGIPCYWIVNLVDRRIEVYAQPTGPAPVPSYGPFQTYRPGDAVPLVLNGITVGTVPAADLLP